MSVVWIIAGSSERDDGTVRGGRSCRDACGSRVGKPLIRIPSPCYVLVVGDIVCTVPVGESASFPGISDGIPAVQDRFHSSLLPLRTRQGFWSGG